LVAQASKGARESRAADRIFGLLAEDQRDHFRALWDEFERQQSAESQFAAAVDRFQPLRVLGDIAARCARDQIACETRVAVFAVVRVDPKVSSGRGGQSPNCWRPALGEVCDRVNDEAAALPYGGLLAMHCLRRANP
jgi:hypothetical protein